MIEINEEDYARYREFNDYIGKGLVDKACALLGKYPGIVNLLGPAEGERAYVEIRKWDVSEADYLKPLIFNRFHMMFDNFAHIESMVKIYEGANLEASLAEISPKSQQEIRAMPYGERNAKMKLK